MNKRVLVGKVVSDKNNKTIVVNVERKFQHSLYKKVVKSFKKYHAHDENNIAKEGFMVSIKESRPISKNKTWVVVNVLNQDNQSKS